MRSQQASDRRRRARTSGSRDLVTRPLKSDKAEVSGSSPLRPTAFPWSEAVSDARWGGWAAGQAAKGKEYYSLVELLTPNEGQINTMTTDQMQVLASTSTWFLSDSQIVVPVGSSSQGLGTRMLGDQVFQQTASSPIFGPDHPSARAW